MGREQFTVDTEGDFQSILQAKHGPIPGATQHLPYEPQRDGDLQRGGSQTRGQIGSR